MNHATYKKEGLEMSGRAAHPLMPAPYLTVDVAASITGYSEKAIRRKIQEGIWLEGREYRKSPDGRILISIKGFTSWVEQGQA